MRDQDFLGLETPADRVRKALPWVATTIETVDADGLLSDLRAVQVCVDSLKRAATKFDPTRSSWERWAVTAMTADLEVALEGEQHKHSVELLADSIYSEAGDAR